MTDTTADAVPRVRIVVVTYFPGDFLTEFLSSLPNASAHPVSVSVVDNGSTDGSVERVRRDPAVDLVESGSNRGYGGAANLGVARATEEWVVVVNPDIEFEEGSIARTPHPHRGRNALPLGP